ncbi:hypothetical protein JMN32_22480 [Fulvivirga sp. 29W222]|uniref:Uncharacterized protein n=1 Tax=Fulvivirga marina TaxID=2494733 RepID=A0A937FZN7_9BACT|nr:hypothetical protein [Fulvivirga marina]MBL6449095.1 hypothetical protein [Fulvivirga marina]
MTKVKALLILLGIVTLSVNALAQVPATMKLESSEAISGEQKFPIESTIEISGGNIVWTQFSQSGSSQEVRFVVSEVSGDWDQSTNQGVLTYAVEIDGSTKEVIIDSTADLTEVKIDPDNQYAIRVVVHTISYN